MNPTIRNTLPAVTLSVSCTTALAEQKVLHVYNWSDYIAEDTLANFEAATGIGYNVDKVKLAYPNGNAAATQYVDEEIRNDPGIYPTKEAGEKLYTFADLSPKVIHAMTRSWTRIKSGQ